LSPNTVSIDWSGSSVTMQREKRIKSWKRAWKIELIEKDNPHWIDLYPGIS
jgi:predicted GIY-YIG superfamily endonuclease